MRAEDTVLSGLLYGKVTGAVLCFALPRVPVGLVFLAIVMSLVYRRFQHRASRPRPIQMTRL